MLMPLKSMQRVDNRSSQMAAVGIVSGLSSSSSHSGIIVSGVLL